MQNLHEYENGFDLRGHEPEGEAHFDCSGFTRKIVLRQWKKAIRESRAVARLQSKTRQVSIAEGASR